MDEHPADELFRRALIDADASAAVALRVMGLPAVRGADGRLPRPARPRHDPDLRRPRRARRRRGRRRRRAACACRATSTSPRPSDREEAEQLYAEQAAALRDALEAADTVLDIWREPLEDLAQARVGGRPPDRARGAPARAPAAARRARGARQGDRRHRRLLRRGRSPRASRRWGSPAPSRTSPRVYPLPDDPERCLEDFFEHAAEHARRVGEQLGRQEQSVRRFLELSGEGFADTA